MIYILGTTHDIQYGDHPTKSRRFNKFLGQMVDDLKISILAEEVNKINFANPNHWMIVSEYAQNYGLEHIWVEPEIEEREKYGLRDVETIARCAEILGSDAFSEKEKEPYWKIMDEHNDKREKIWFERIKDKKETNTLLIVGAWHVSTHPHSRGRGIDTILRENGYDYTILPFIE